MNKQVTRICIGAVVLIGILNSGLFANPIFTEDFSLWTGRSGGAHHELITAGPLNSDNNAPTFTATNSGGDSFTIASFNLVAGQQYSVSFDYLGMPGQIPGGSGGFAGLAQGYPGTHLWYDGTNTTSGAAPIRLSKTSPLMFRQPNRHRRRRLCYTTTGSSPSASSAASRTSENAST